ncbi:MAG: hypothetical protein ACKPCI_29675 [Dolichospermum sp.]
MNHPQQPREYDAVLGGNSPSPEGAAVLGGIEGVKLRLQNPDAKVRTAALEQALNYGEQGLDLVIVCLNDESIEVQLKAYSLLVSWNKKHEIPNLGLLDKIGKLIFKPPINENGEQRLIGKVNQALIDSDAHFSLGSIIKLTQLVDDLTVKKLRIVTEKLKTQDQKTLENLQVHEESVKQKIRRAEDLISSFIEAKRSLIEQQKRLEEADRSLIEAQKRLEEAFSVHWDKAQRLKQEYQEWLDNEEG